MNSPATAIGVRIQFIESAFTFAPRADEFAIREQAEMRGDARLAESRDFLKFVHGTVRRVRAARRCAVASDRDNARKDFRVEDIDCFGAKFFEKAFDAS